MLDLEFTQVQPISYAYDEIHEILSDAVHGLIQKRNNKIITLLETAQLERYYFNTIVLSSSPGVKRVLWEIYREHGRTGSATWHMRKALIATSSP